MKLGPHFINRFNRPAYEAIKLDFFMVVNYCDPKGFIRAEVLFSFEDHFLNVNKKNFKILFLQLCSICLEDLLNCFMNCEV